MRKNVAFVLLLLPLMLTSCVSVMKPDKTDQQLAGLLMQRSGLNTQLEQMPRIMQTVLVKGKMRDPELKELSEARFQELARATDLAFDAVSLKEDVQQRLTSGLSPDDIQAALEWHESSLGKKIRAIEEAASLPESFEERQESLSRTGGSADRILSIRKLDSAIKGTESAMNAFLSTQVAVITGLTAGLPEKERPSVDEILDAMKKMEPDWRQSAEREVLMYFLDIYRPLSDADVDQYIGFAESAPGQKYHAVVVDGVMDAMLRASRRLGNQLGQKTTEVRSGR